MKRRVAEILGLPGTIRPGLRQRAEEIIVRVADPEARFRREPIELAQPLRGRFEARVIEDLRFSGTGILPVGPRAFRVAGWKRCLTIHSLPIVAGPEPQALIALAAGQQAPTHGVVQQLDDNLRRRRTVAARP